MKNEVLNALELDGVVAATKPQGGDHDINIADSPNVRVDVTPI